MPSLHSSIYESSFRVDLVRSHGDNDVLLIAIGTYRNPKAPIMGKDCLLFNICYVPVSPD